MDNKKYLDQKGVEFLWSKIRMQDYPNNETLVAVITAIDETKADIKDIPSIEGLATESYVDTKVDELFQNVSNGKGLIASAITDKGVYASDDETFQELSDKIGLIPVGPPGTNIIGYIDEENDIYVSLTELENGTYTLKFEDYNGLLDDFEDIGTVEVK